MLASCSVESATNPKKGTPGKSARSSRVIATGRRYGGARIRALLVAFLIKNADHLSGRACRRVGLPILGSSGSGAGSDLETMRMEQTVERAASSFQSESFQVFSAAVNYIGWQRGSDLIKFSRLLQELLAYKRGALLDNLIGCICTIASDHEGDERHNLQLQACRLIAVLSESVPVAKYFMKDKQKIRPIARALMNAQKYLLRHIPRQLSGRRCIPEHLMADPKGGKETYVYFELAFQTVRAFDNLSRASKSFRLALQELEAFFPSLEKLVSRDITSPASLDVLHNALTNVHSLMRTLAFSEDIQQWSFDQGIVRIQAAITRILIAKGVFTGEGLVTGMGPPSAEMRRVLASQERELLNLDKQLRRYKNSEKARRMRTLFVDSLRDKSASFESFLTSIHGHLPRTVRRMEQETRRFQESEAASLEWSGAPIVCSWELCEAGSASEAGRPFSKCANCALAYYCRSASKRSQAALPSRDLEWFFVSYGFDSETRSVERCCV